MILIPAIDLKSQKVVRLYKGRFGEATFYNLSPIDAAGQWVSMGAKWLHVVDLDGAQTGEMKNLNVIKDIIKRFKIPVQVGGGIRSMDAVQNLIEAGAARVILGTKVVEVEGMIDKTPIISNILRKYGPEKVAVSLDCLDGFVTQRGWTETSNISGVDLAQRLETLGVQNIIYTDIATDGTLHGPNFNGVSAMLDAVSAHVQVISSGGVSSLDDIKHLKLLRSKDGHALWGAITGKAIYEGKLDFKQAVKVC